jgi:hypothetical protein
MASRPFALRPYSILDNIRKDPFEYEWYYSHKFSAKIISETLQEPCLSGVSGNKKLLTKLRNSSTVR